MKEKIKFLKYLLYFYKNESIGVKIYLFLRLIIFPLKFLKEIEKIDNNSILDIGCGYGITSLYLKYKGFNSNVLGLDINKKRIDLLNKNTKRLKINNLNFLNRDLINEGFFGLEGYNTSLLVDILHHLDLETQNNLLKYLSENIDILIIKDIDIIPKYKYYWNYFHDKYLMKNDILCFQGREKIEKYLIELGYKVKYKEIKSIFPYPHYLLIAEK